MEKLGGEPDPVLQVDDDPTVAREGVQPVGAQAVRPIRLQLDLAVESVSHRHESAPHQRLSRELGQPPHAEELAFDERVFERTAPRPRRGAERAEQKPPGKREPPGPLKGGADRGLRTQDRRGIAELEGERRAQVEVFVPEHEAHVVLDRELGARELDAREKEAEAPFVRKGEAFRCALDRPEPGLFPAITREESRNRPVAFQGQPAPSRHLEEARVHSETRDLRAVAVQPGLAARLVEEERASRRRIERAETAREKEVPPIAVAVGVVEQVEPEAPPQELRIGIERLARRSVGPLRRRERHLLAQPQEVLLLDRHPVVALPARAAEGTGDLRGPGVARVNHHVDLAVAPFHRLRRDGHRPKESQKTQILFGLRHVRRLEQAPLGKQQLPPDDLRPGHAVNRVGRPRQKRRLGILEDVLRLDPDASDARRGLRRNGGSQVRRKENAQKEGARPRCLSARRPRTRIHGRDAR